MGSIARWCLVAGLALLVAGCQRATREGGSTIAAPPEAAASMAEPASDFSLKTLGGEEITLSDLKGKPVVINFWASWCPPCRQEAPGLEAVYKKYREQGFTIIGIASGDNEKDVRAAVKEFGLTFPVGLSDETARAYGVSAIPTNFFVDREGKIAKKHVGAMSERDFEAAVKKLL